MPLGGPARATLLTLGFGGATTDLVVDRARLLASGAPGQVGETLDELHAASRAFTDRPQRDTVRDTALRVGWLAARLPPRIEAEFNPLVIHEDNAVAVDARIRLDPEAR